MSGSDEEFEDFLKRRKPIFRKPDDMFEPPAEIDRIVLRQARDAIETEQPLRVFRTPRWATPVALAATLLLAFTVIFQAGMPQKRKALMPEVTVQNVAQRIEDQESPAPAAMAPASSADDRVSDAAAPGEAVADLSQPMAARREMAAPAPRSAVPASSADGLVAREEADRHAAASPRAAPAAAGSAGDAMARARRADSTGDAPALVVTVPAAKSTEVPTWRRDSKTWLAEIERLRNAGDTARASAELEEYKRQHRAYAAGPDQ
ncbi:MAG TPA: hypothetical protein VGO61_15830 [Steroidobacteraceae bacterium]|nr:hypothetical protein [Steroidobacteraceae bacterium]